MKYIKTYEESDYDILKKHLDFSSIKKYLNDAGEEHKKFTTKRDLLDSAILYLNRIIPISKEDGFVNFGYIYSERNNLFLCYFKKSTSKKILNKFQKFLDSNNIKYFINNIGKVRDELEFRFSLTGEQLVEYAEIVDSLKKYNL